MDKDFDKKLEAEQKAGRKDRLSSPLAVAVVNEDDPPWRPIVINEKGEEVATEPESS